MGLSPAYPAVQRTQALAIAEQFDLNLVEIATDELSDPEYAANAPSRCYFCKSELWRKLTALAAERGIAIVADGTNASDLDEHRPGLRASVEFGVRSPLAEAGYAKAQVRGEARRLGIPIWSAPAAPCLSSRIMYGLKVTRDRLSQVERGEDALRAMGIKGDLRLRHRGTEARIEVSPSEFELVRKNRRRIGELLLKLGFDRVTLDLGGYRRGSLLKAQAPELELVVERG